jgi:hypothetical protein
LYTTDMARKLDPFKMRKQNKSVWDVEKERDAGGAYLHNFGSTGAVSVEWGMNEDTTRDQIFKIKIGDREALLNTEEVMRFLRWV